MHDPIRLNFELSPHFIIPAKIKKIQSTNMYVFETLCHQQMWSGGLGVGVDLNEILEFLGKLKK